MLSKKLKWYPLFESEQELKELFAGKNSLVHRTMFGEVVLVHHKDKYYAFENKCPHQGKRLEGCWLENDQLVCPWHQYHFALDTGRGQGLYLEKYELRINEKGVFLGKERWSLF